MTVTVVVGNPTPRSRIWAAAHLVAQRPTGQPADRGVDVVDRGVGLLTPSDPAVAQAIAGELVVIASPTFRAPAPVCSSFFSTRSEPGNSRWSRRCP